MAGGNGNDTYVVNNITKSFVEIEDTGGTDNLQIKGVNVNDLLFFFDVVVNENTEYGYADDGLYIIHRNFPDSVISQMKKFMSDPNNINNVPQAGAVCIEYYFGNTNNLQQNGKYGTNYGNKHIENISAVNSAGVKYTYDIKSYVSAVRPKVLDFLKKNGYNTAVDVMFSGNAELIKNCKTYTKALP